MENNEQNLAGELDELVPIGIPPNTLINGEGIPLIIAPADNDVFTPGFCSLLDPTFKWTPAASQEAGINDDG
jgi:hypothetical protein